METIYGRLLSAATAALKKVESVDERARIKSMLFEFCNHLEHVQNMPMMSRLVFWECCYYLFDFLRRRKELTRKNFGFSSDTKAALKQFLG